MKEGHSGLRTPESRERGIPAELKYLKGGGAWRLNPKEVTPLMAKSNAAEGARGICTKEQQQHVYR